MGRGVGSREGGGQRGKELGGWPEQGCQEPHVLPMLERAEERSMMVRLPGLLSTDRFARERSAVTRVIEILGGGE